MYAFCIPDLPVGLFGGGGGGIPRESDVDPALSWLCPALTPARGDGVERGAACDDVRVGNGPTGCARAVGDSAVADGRLPDSVEAEDRRGAGSAAAEGRRGGRGAGPSILDMGLGGACCSPGVEIETEERLLW